MEDRIKILAVEIRELEDVMQFMAKKQAPFSYKGFEALTTQIEAMKKELATMEAQLRRETRHFIMCN